MVDRTPAHLTDMLQFVRELRSLAHGADCHGIRRNRIGWRWKLFINLGEAAYRVGDERAREMPDIPRRRIIGLRNLRRTATSKWRTRFCSRRLPMTFRRWKVCLRGG